MVKVKYIDHEGDAEEVEVFGVKFKDGKSTEVDADTAARLKGNRFFEVVAHEAKPKAAETQGKAADATTDVLEAVHRGRGVYAIVKGDDVLKEGLTKDEAETFNALPTEEAKEEYLTKPAADPALSASETPAADTSASTADASAKDETASADASNTQQ